MRADLVAGLFSLHYIVPVQSAVILLFASRVTLNQRREKRIRDIDFWGSFLFLKL